MGRVERALVVAAGDAENTNGLPPADIVIAADSGADLARSFGRRVDVLVGDMDSVSEQARRAVEESGGRIVRHRTDKDLTDLELALAVAVESAPSVHVVVTGGGRLDHCLANIAVLASPRWEAAAVEATIGRHRLWVVRDRCRIDGEAGEIVSLLPVGGPAHGVTTTGLRFALAAETLDPTEGRGVSNEITEPPAVVSVGAGVLVAIKPHGP